MANDSGQALKDLFTENAESDLLIVSHTIDSELYFKISNELDKANKSEKLTVFLTTYGGDPHKGFRIARCLRHHYKFVRIVVPSFCKSAGTLIVISADEIAIGDFGELGPLDIQVSKPNEIQETSSGLDLSQALEAIRAHTLTVFQGCMVDLRFNARLSTKMASEIAYRLAADVVGPLYNQIDPVKIGELQRAMRITNEYGARLNKYSNNLKPDALSKLVSGYPSHGFVIDRKEAKELFNKVTTLNKTEQAFCDTIFNVLKDENSTVGFFQKQSELTNETDKKLDDVTETTPKANNRARRKPIKSNGRTAPTGV